MILFHFPPDQLLLVLNWWLVSKYLLASSQDWSKWPHEILMKIHSSLLKTLFVSHFLTKSFLKLQKHNLQVLLWDLEHVYLFEDLQWWLKKRTLCDLRVDLWHFRCIPLNMKSWRLFDSLNLWSNSWSQK